MTEHILTGLAAIVIIGIVAQWLAWRFHLPSILVLLIFGFLAGPITGFLHPDELLGDLFFPVVSLSVAIILFEGGLSLKLSELRAAGRAVRNLVSIGIVVTWILSAVAAYYILGLGLELAVLLGAILVVTGPTVIIPLLRQIRPTGRADYVAKWEGIINDPIGAVLAVLVFEAILAGRIQEVPALAIAGLLYTLAIGVGLGLIAAGILILLLRRHWLPDYLQNPVALMLVIAGFALSNMLQEESGLLTVTVMGIALANQRIVSIRHIVEFKENLRVLLISGLFILLAARLQLSELAMLNAGSLIFLAVLIIIVRPVAVFLSSLGSELNWRERLFVAWLAPRGIVAAAVASLFALRLVEANYSGAEQLVPIMFLVIVGTVAIYGLTITPLARWLKVADANPQGLLFVGAHPWARQMAEAVKARGFRVLMVDTNWKNLSAARLAGLPTFHASIASDTVVDELDLNGIGRLLAVTPNDEINSLAALHFKEVFDRSEIYQLVSEAAKNSERKRVSAELRGRSLFQEGVTYEYLQERMGNGAVLKATNLTKAFSYKQFQQHHGGRTVPLFLIDESDNLIIYTVDNPPTPKSGQTIISLIDPPDESTRKIAQATVENDPYQPARAAELENLDRIP